MSISQQLIDRYTYEVDVDWFEAIAINHSTFISPYYIHNGATKEDLTGYMDGGVQTFRAVQFQLSLPARDNGGRSDLTLTIGTIGSDIQLLLDGALATPEEPISVQYTCYLLTDTTALYDPPLLFNMTEVTSDDRQITAVARLGDTINRPFPNGRYTVESFPGLNRR
ncbi:DUF1833 domain-containing protein [bacterium]|nr:DUF1833 domain-containing protein [bacterium]